MSEAVITRRERDTHWFNRRGLRPGIFGMSIDVATGKELDRQAAIFGVFRERARLFGFTMPWGQLDETLRKRVFLTYQGSAAPAACVHNVWCGYDTGTRCGDCGEWLYWVPRKQADKMHLFTTKLPEGKL